MEICMKNNYYMEILKCALNKTPPSKDAVRAISLSNLYHFAKLNKLIPLFTTILSYWPVTSKEDEDCITYWKDEATHSVFLEYKKFSLIKQLCTLAKERNLSITFFKGYILADLYPNFTLRTSSDTDILIDSSKLTQLFTLLADLHYSHMSELDSEQVYTYVYEEDGYPIHKLEIHTSLFENMHGAQISYLEELALSSPEKNISFSCCGIHLETLNHQEHLIYQIFHMIKHFGCHGFPARYLIDVALFIQKYHTAINWFELENIMNTLGYSVFYRQLITILLNYFDVPKDIFKNMALYSLEEISDLRDDILHFGMRSYPDEISNAFYYFETYIESLECKENKLLDTITFDGNTVPVSIVSLHFQENSDLQKRIHLLRNLRIL